MKKSSVLLRTIVIGLLLPGELLLASCARHEPPAPAATEASGASLPGGLEPAASMLDLMHDPIDRNANALWEAVSSVSTLEGTKDIVPATDEEWLALRRQALVLMETSNLLVIDGRRVAHPGQQLEGHGDSTAYTPEQAQAEIDKDRTAFVAFAGTLQAAARQIVTAIDSRNVEQYLNAGDALQGACEACHLRFWYPEAAQPPGL